MEMKLSTQCGTAILILLCFLSGIWAQEMSCIRQLLPCITLLNTSHNPSDSCCEPLKYLTGDLPECLCSIFGAGGAFIPELAGINLTQVQQLPERCGEPVKFPGCLTGRTDSNTDITNAARQSFGFTNMSIIAALLMALQVMWTWDH